MIRVYEQEIEENFKCNTDGFQFYGGIYLSDLHNEQVFNACKLTRKNSRKINSCKNKEKFQLKNLVFGRIREC